MTCKFVCDGCGKEQPAYANRFGDWFKPSQWYQRSDDTGTYVTCSRECIDKLAEKTGMSKLVLPV